MNKKEKRRSHSEWLRLVMRFKSGVMSCKEFCTQEGISSSSFYKWRDILREELAEDVEKISKDFIPLKVRDELPSSLLPEVKAINSELKINAKSGFSIELASGCLLAELRAILEAIDVDK